MWTDTSEGREFIREISHGVIAQVAPEELDLFDELITDYFQDPAPPDPAAAADDPLGFGLDETIVAFTPAAAAMAHVVLNHLLTASITAAKDESAQAMKKKFRAYFDRKKNAGESNPAAGKDKDVPPLTREQMEQVHQLAIAQAIKFGVDQENAEKMAAALVGSIVLTK